MIFYKSDERFNLITWLKFGILLATSGTLAKSKAKISTTLASHQGIINIFDLKRLNIPAMRLPLKIMSM